MTHHMHNSGLLLLTSAARACALSRTHQPPRCGSQARVCGASATGRCNASCTSRRRREQGAVLPAAGARAPGEQTRLWCACSACPARPPRTAGRPCPVRGARICSERRQGPAARSRREGAVLRTAAAAADTDAVALLRQAPHGPHLDPLTLPGSCRQLAGRHKPATLRAHAALAARAARPPLRCSAGRSPDVPAPRSGARARAPLQREPYPNPATRRPTLRKASTAA